MKGNIAGRLSAIMGASAIALAAGGPLATAQLGDDTVPVDADEGEAALKQDVVVVTAQRREQDLQDVPISVTAITGEQIDTVLAFDTQSLTQLSPSLVISTSSSEAQGTQIRLRGIGTAGSNAGLESSVGVYVNGVYIARSGIALTDQIDIERIEVLRGPQGTLFGKNTSAGAILVRSRRPEFDFGASATLQAGDFDLIRATGHVTGPIIEDQLAFRLAGGFQEREGFITDTGSGDDLNDRSRFLIRGSLLGKLGDRGEVFLSLDYNERDEKCCAAPQLINGPVTTNDIAALGGTVFDPVSFDEVALNQSPVAKTEEIGFQGNLTYDLGFADFGAIVGYRDYQSDRSLDSDFTDVDLFVTPFEVLENELFSLEATLAGQAGRLDWTLGAYYFDETLSQESALLYGSQTGDFLAGRLAGTPLQPFIPSVAPLYPEGQGDELRDFDQESTGWSLFTHNIIGLTETTELTVGLRYLEEEKEGGGVIENSNAPICTSPLPLPASLRVVCPTANFESEFEDDQLVGTLALRQSFTEDISAYVSYARGFKSGGINFDRTAGLSDDSRTFEPETVDAYELGLKTQWFDRRLTVNGAWFRQEYDDFQVNVFDGVVFTVANQPEETVSEGFELEVSGRPVAGLSVNAGATYAETEVDGQQIAFAPRWSAVAGAQYFRPLTSAITGFGSVNLRYTSSQLVAADRDPETEQGDNTIVNARAGLRFVDQDLTLSLFARNLLDEEYSLIIFDSIVQPGSFNQFPAEPRIWGVEVAKRF